MTELRGDTPKKIDRYEILEAIGFGAMGAVYKAFDPLIKRPVALKTLRLDVPPQSPDYRDFLKRFAVEARVAGRLSHANIVTLYDVGHTPDQLPWLAMEYVDGQTVAELLEGERLRPEMVVGLVSQIASALDYAHAEGVVHRDIKPSNVIVHAGEKVKVTDFGIAKLMDADSTHSGLMMGTPSYMSPEQAMGEDLDGATDIFSLGVVAFEMLSGQQPFPGNNVTSILYKLVHSDPVQPDDLEVLGLLPDKWHEVFSKALAKDPAERYPSAAAFVQDLELCLGSWFGSLEGETVIVRDPSELGMDPLRVGPGTDQDETVALERRDPGSHEDETVALSSRPPPEAAASAGAAGAKREDERRPEATLAGGGTPVPAAGSEETIFGPSREEPEETLYASSSADETVTAELTAGDETVVPAESGTERIPKRSALRGRLTRIGLPALAIGAALSWAFIRAPDERTVEPVVIPPPPPMVAISGSLVIATEPEGATVRVNGEPRGTTPIELEELPFGAYDLTIEQPGFRAEELAVELTAEEPRAAFELTLQPAPAPPKPAYVEIRSAPEGAEVQIDGESVGSTPTARLRVAPGARQLRLLREGFVPWEDTVEARAGRTETIEAELIPSAAHVEAGASSEPPDAPRVPEGALVSRGDPGVVNPRCIDCPAVGYPEAARRARMQGVVELSFLIDENGEVRDIGIQQSAGEIFDNAVVETVKTWRYQPATQNGVRVKMRWVQRFRFQQGR